MIAFNLYLTIPYGKIRPHHPDIVRVAKLLGRTPNSLALKIGNLASADPKRTGKGLRTIDLEREVLGEFGVAPGEVMVASEKLLRALLEGKEGENLVRDADALPYPDVDDLPEGKESRRLVNVRENQSVFRRAVLAAYDHRCCMTGISAPQLLNASHIIPWSDEAKERINPRNGLCLNALHDRAFDRGLISVSPDALVVHVSPQLHALEKQSEKIRFILESEGQTINKPERFPPDAKFLEHHYRNIFQN